MEKNNKILSIKESDHALLKLISTNEGRSMRSMFSILLENYVKDSQAIVGIGAEIHAAIDEIIGNRSHSEEFHGNGEESKEDESF